MVPTLLLPPAPCLRAPGLRALKATRAAALCGVALALLPACSPFEPPVVEAAALADTQDSQGPYPVAARVTARRSISKVELVWHNAAIGPGQAVHVAMAQDDQGVYRAAIPAQCSGALPDGGIGGSCSPTGASNWGDDILDTDILLPGDHGTVLFSRYDGAYCSYDIKVIGDSGEEGYIYGVNLCLIDSVTFR